MFERLSPPDVVTIEALHQAVLRQRERHTLPNRAFRMQVLSKLLGGMAGNIISTRIGKAAHVLGVEKVEGKYSREEMLQKAAHHGLLDVGPKNDWKFYYDLAEGDQTKFFAETVEANINVITKLYTFLAIESGLDIGIMTDLMWSVYKSKNFVTHNLREVPVMMVPSDYVFDNLTVQNRLASIITILTYVVSWKDEQVILYLRSIFRRAQAAAFAKPDDTTLFGESMGIDINTIGFPKLVKFVFPSLSYRGLPTKQYVSTIPVKFGEVPQLAIEGGEAEPGGSRGTKALVEVGIVDREEKVEFLQKHQEELRECIETLVTCDSDFDWIEHFQLWKKGPNEEDTKTIRESLGTFVTYFRNEFMDPAQGHEFALSEVEPVLIIREEDIIIPIVFSRIARYRLFRFNPDLQDFSNFIGWILEQVWDIGLNEEKGASWTS